MLTESYKNRLFELAGIINEDGRVDFLKNKFKEWSDEKYIELQQKSTKKKIKMKPEYDQEMNDVFNKLVEADPSVNKQNLQWLMRLYTSGNILLEDLYKATEYLQLYEKVKQKLPVENRDINK